MNENKISFESANQYLQEVYPGYPQRFPVPEDKRKWNEPFEDYNPPEYTHVRSGKEKIADPSNPKDILEDTWKLREKYLAEYSNIEDKTIRFDDNGYPLNPVGRTGLKGRGVLEKWGPNPCADPIVFRKNKDQWELLVVVRRDNGKIALPGGKINIDEGESVLNCVQREASEETKLEIDFSNAILLKYGHIKDERETDNAWLTTEGKIKILSPEEIDKYRYPQGASDAKEAKWIIVDNDILKKMHAEHGKMIQQALQIIKDK